MARMRSDNTMWRLCKGEHCGAKSRHTLTVEDPLAEKLVWVWECGNCYRKTPYFRAKKELTKEKTA